MRKKINITKGINNISELLVLSGRSLGEKQREKLQLENIDKDQNQYVINIPNNIVSINPSFFLGLFGKSVRFFKTKEEFLEKYKFECNSNVLITIYDGINDALNNIDVLR